jgi:GAF domain-containing protein
VHIIPPVTERDAADAATEADALLHRALLASERRAATLSELSRALASTRDPVGLARRAVDLVARATGAVGAFVYLWDPASERLVLRAAEGRSLSFVDAISLRMGEGVIGWAALMRRQVVINEGLQDDPRFVVLPGLGDNEYRSMLAAPIRVAGDDVVGVFVLHALVEHAFTDDDASLVDEVATLVASGIDQAETVEDLRRASSAARFLLGLPRDAFTSSAALARELARRVPLLVPADVCVVELLHGGGLDDAAGVTVATRPSAVPDKPARSGSYHVQVLDRGALERLLVARGAGGDPLVLPLRLGPGPPLGVLTLYAARPFTAGDRAMADGIAAQAGTALAATSREGGASVLAALRDTSDDAQALSLLRRLGWRRSRAVPVVLRVAGARDAEDHMRRVLQDVLEPAGSYTIPGAASGGARGALVPIGPNDDGLPSAVAEAVRRAVGAGLVVGVGSVLEGPAPDMGAAVRAAWTAALWAELARGTGVVRHDEVAYLATLPAVAQRLSSHLRQLVDAFAAVAAQDADLLRTLDVYLAQRGSIERTAAELVVHRNTVRRRLRRAQEIAGCSVDGDGDWLAAALAARLVHLSVRPQIAGSSAF